MVPAAGVAVFPHPLAWDGLLSFWLRNGAFAVFVIVMFFVLRSALHRQTVTRSGARVVCRRLRYAARGVRPTIWLMLFFPTWYAVILQSVPPFHSIPLLVSRRRLPARPRSEVDQPALRPRNALVQRPLGLLLWPTLSWRWPSSTTRTTSLMVCVRDLADHLVIATQMFVFESRSVRVERLDRVLVGRRRVLRLAGALRSTPTGRATGAARCAGAGLREHMTVTDGRQIGAAAICPVTSTCG